MHHDAHHHHPSDSGLREYVKFAGVIVIIFILSLVAFFANDGSTGQDFLQVFMGVFLLVFAGFKFAGYKMFVAMFPSYDLLAERSERYARAYPFIELFLGLLFVLDIAPDARNIAVVIIMGIGALGVLREVAVRRRGIQCACLGNIIKLPLSTVSLIENLSMVAMATYMLVVM